MNWDNEYRVYGVYQNRISPELIDSTSDRGRAIRKALRAKRSKEFVRVYIREIRTVWDRGLKV